jgi:hypothetical protein
MTTGIYIPQSTDLPIQRTIYATTGDYRRAVHGFVDAIILDGPPMMLVVNARWQYPQLPVNRRATELCWLHNPILRMQVLIGGDAVLVGPPEEDGTPRDVPPDFATFMLDTTQFQLEHRNVSGPRWPVHRRTFSDYFSAAAYGVDLITDARRDTHTTITAESKSGT